MTSKIPSNVEIVLEETAELGHAPAEQPEAQQDEPSSLSPYMQGSEHDSNSGQAWGEPAAQPTFFCSPPRKGRVPPPLDEPAGGYHMANMNFRAETDEMKRTGLIEFWPYNMRKSPNRSKKRLWHGDDMVAAEEELEKGEAERQKWRRNEEEERRKAEELARQRAEEQARLLPHTKGGVVFLPRAPPPAPAPAEPPAERAVVVSLRAEEAELRAKVRAIANQIKQLHKETGSAAPFHFSSRQPVPPPTPPLVQPDILNAKEEDYVLCPKRCGRVIRRRDLAPHEAHKCRMRVVRCPMPGCHTRVHAGEVRAHLRDGCKVALARRRLVQRAKEKLIPLICPAGCGEWVLSKNLRAHHADHCDMRFVTCTNHGCGARVRAREMGEHLASSCLYIKMRQLLLDELRRKHELITCPDCQSGVQKAHMHRHRSDECSHRPVTCPWGCGLTVQLAQTDEHRKSCPVVRNLEAVAKRGRARRGFMDCPACGARFLVTDRARHNREDCTNRKVPCKNWECGCHQMIRIRMRKLHEKVDHLMGPRPCLHFLGGQALVALGEADLKPGWTAEFWVLKADIVDRTRLKCRRALEELRVLQKAETQLRRHEKAVKDLAAEQTAIMQGEAAERKAKKRQADADLKSPRKDEPKITREAAIAEAEKRAAKMKAYSDALVKHAEAVQAWQVCVAVAQYKYNERILAAARSTRVMQRRGRSLRLLLDRQGNGRRGNGVLSPSGLSVVSENDEDYDDDQPKAYVDDGEEERKEQEQGQGSLGKDEAQEAKANNEGSYKRPDGSLKRPDGSFTQAGGESDNDRRSATAKRRGLSNFGRESSSSSSGRQSGVSTQQGRQSGVSAQQRRQSGESGNIRRSSQLSGSSKGQGLGESLNNRGLNASLSGGLGHSSSGHGYSVLDMLAQHSIGLQEEPDDDVFDRFPDGLALAEEVESLARRVFDQGEGPLRKRMNKLTGSLASSSRDSFESAGSGASSASGASSIAGNKAAKARRAKEKKKAERLKKRNDVHGYSVEDQAVGKVLGEADGWDVIAASDTVRLMLEANEKDEVGFAVSGVGTWAFPFRVPEGEWTHLAFVSSPAAAIPTDNPEAPGLNATLGATNGANLGATNGGGEAKGRGAPPTNPAGGPKPPVGPGGANAARIEGPWGRRKSVSNKVVQLYANGELISTIDLKGSRLADAKAPGGGQGLWLPRMTIGATDRALHGYIQEVRYWGVQRTSSEIEATWRRLLPPTSVAQGLLGWWTMEEGKGEYIDDVTESRYRIRLDKTGIRWTDSVKLNMDAPTPQFRETLACPVELKRARLVQKARMHFQLVPCPLSCGMDLMRRNLSFHVQHECAKRQVSCKLPGCNMRFPYADKEKHERVECPAVANRLAILGDHDYRYEMIDCPIECGLKLHRKDMEQHRKNECPLRLVVCPACELTLPANRLRAHRKRFCEASAALASDQFLVRQKLEEKLNAARHYPRPWTANMEVADPWGDEVAKISGEKKGSPKR